MPTRVDMDKQVGGKEKRLSGGRWGRGNIWNKTNKSARVERQKENIKISLKSKSQKTQHEPTRTFHPQSLNGKMY